jgi:molybdenum cofactor biosynthesis protein B
MAARFFRDGSERAGMVDFQSRDRRRDEGTDDTEETADETAEETDDVTGEAEQGEPVGSVTDDAGATEDDPGAVPYAVVTVTDERTVRDDPPGAAVVDAIETDGDPVALRELIPPSFDEIQSTVQSVTKRDDVAAVVTVGGVGVEPDNVTVDAARALFDKELPGFGELFRVLSHEQEGTAVVRTRVTAGIVDETPVFCLPDDTAGARRGVEQIVLAEAETIVDEARLPEES